MYACMDIQEGMCIYNAVCLYACLYVWALRCVCMYVYVHGYVRICMRFLCTCSVCACLFVSVYVRGPVYMCKYMIKCDLLMCLPSVFVDSYVCVCVYVCMYVCMCIW